MQNNVVKATGDINIELLAPGNFIIARRTLFYLLVIIIIVIIIFQNALSTDV